MLTQYITKYRDIFLIIAVVLISSVSLYLPFLFQTRNWLGIEIQNPTMEYVYRHFDGPLYIVAAKTMYKPELINALHLELVSSPNYYAAHLPLYPIFIRIFSFVLGYLRSTIVVSLIFSVLAAVSFFYVLKKLKISENPLLLTMVFLFLPRFFVVRSVGAPETIFLFFIILSLYFFERKQFLLSGLCGGLSVMTKSPGILLFFAYGLVFIEEFIRTKKIKWEWSGVCLIPVGLLAVFLIYDVQYGDFFAYFNSGDNIHLVSPFAVFNHNHQWVGTGWLEEVALYLLLYLYSVISLIKNKHRSFFYFSLIFFVATSFVQHRDISRYILPMWPLVCIANEKFFTSKRFLITLIILLPAIYLYAINFMTFNLMPISDWTPYI